MCKRVCVVLVLIVASFNVVTAGTLVEECSNLCGVVGQIIEEKNPELPEETQNWLSDYGFIKSDWVCNDMKKMALALGKKIKERKEEGTINDFIDNVKKSHEILAKRMMEGMKENIGSGCSDKFEEIMKYLRENIGEI